MNKETHSPAALFFIHLRASKTKSLNKAKQEKGEPEARKIRSSLEGAGASVERHARLKRAWQKCPTPSKPRPPHTLSPPPQA